MTKKKKKQTETKTEGKKQIKSVFAEERVITENSDEARELYNQSRYGTILDNGKVQLSLLEALYLLEKEIFNQFIGLDVEHGLYLGNVKVSNFNAKINIDRLLNKHFAILSISGGGKSYLTSILIEELLTRNKSYGNPAIILIDVHGEYLYLKNVPEIQDKVKIQDISYFQISVPNLNAWWFRKYQEQISNVQVYYV